MYTIIIDFVPRPGHVDPGECESETALREVEEESGLKKADLKIISGFEKVLNVSDNHLVVY